jgi:uncharacterized protein
VIERREFLAAAGGLALAGTCGVPVLANSRKSALPARARPFDLADVRLLPSRFLDAVTTNQRYLLSLDADRLLHNFRAGAGLPPKGEVYGGWEKDTIAGHTLGHYLSALALTHV